MVIEINTLINWKNKKKKNITQTCTCYNYYMQINFFSSPKKSSQIQKILKNTYKQEKPF